VNQTKTCKIDSKTTNVNQETKYGKSNFDTPIMGKKSKNSRHQDLIVVVHCLCDDPFVWEIKRKTFALNSLGIIFKLRVKLYFNQKKHLLKFSCNVFPNFEC
jgi:hypothetical protein